LTELTGKRRFLNLSFDKPDEQLQDKGSEITSGMHYLMLSLRNPELHLDDYGNKIYGVDELD
jgi:hypothetical protein